MNLSLSKHSVRLLLTLLSFLFLTHLNGNATNFAQADSAYRQKDYVGAVRMYEAALKEHPANDEAAVGYYNLGNAYYRLKDAPHAVLCYQRTLHLDPTNADAAYNLELTQIKLTDHFDAPAEMFFVGWARDIAHTMSSRAWGLWGLAALLFTFVFYECYAVSQRMWLRRTSFGVGVLCLLAFVICQLCAFSQSYAQRTDRLAVVMQPTDTFDSPTPSAKKLQTLHEGTSVKLLDTYQGGWQQVELPDETQCWTKSGALESVEIGNKP